VLEGWFPSAEISGVQAILERTCGSEYYLENAPAEKDDPEIPVKLKNNRIVKAFEDVTTMYATPKYNEIDPTPLFTPFYWIFFGFMVGDIGFGLVLLIGTFLAVKYTNFKPGMKNFLRFFYYCSYGVIAAGAVYSSFFGFTLWKPLLDTQADIPLMLIISIGVGVVQVVFGLMVKGYLLIRDGKPLDALFDSAFWIVTLLGGIAWLVSVTGVLSPAIGNIGMWCFYGGLAGLALTQGRGSATIGGKIGTSLWEVYGISGYVGDLVSYTRIVALCLSGAFIGFSFIQMSAIIPDGPIGFVAKVIIVTLGQVLNFGLGLLGAYVHTCRLQYVEFFGKYFEGGGVPFRPLKPKNDYVSITK
jgi:V/A-type H+-transporting ATPase subunit I